MASGSGKRFRWAAVVLTAAGVIMGTGAVPAWSAPATGAPVTVDLGTLGGQSSIANDINDAGMIAGNAETADGAFHAVRWDRNGTVTDLGTLGVVQSTAERINASGEIIGKVVTSDHKQHAARWNADGTGVDLGTLPGGEESWGTGINDAGTAIGAGYSLAANGGLVLHALRWDAQGRLTDLGAAGPNSSEASGVNSAGVTVGTVNDDHGGVAARWDPDGRMTVLFQLPGAVGSDAVRINDDGVVVGVSTSANDTPHAVRWDRLGRPTDLGTLPGGVESAAAMISRDGTVVGGSSNAAGVNRAVRWDPRGRIFQLEAVPGDSFAFARDINRNGLIVGFSEDTAVMWDQGGRLIDLAPIAADGIGDALAIDAGGDAVGFSGARSGPNHATLWLPAGSAR